MTKLQWRYRIYIANATPDAVASALIEEGIDGTVYYGVGVWEGESEPCAIVEILRESHPIVDDYILANEYAKALHYRVAPTETCVYLTVEHVLSQGTVDWRV